MLNWRCWAISVPWSQVMLRRSDAGKVVVAVIAIADSLRAATMRKVQEQQVAGGAFHERSDGAVAVFAEDQVTFPVAGHRAVVDVGGSFADHHHVGDAGAVFHAPRGRRLRAGAEQRASSRRSSPRPCT